jgi:hypothetical protein
LRSATFAIPPVLTQDSQGPQTVAPLTPPLADQILCIRQVTQTEADKAMGNMPGMHHDSMPGISMRELPKDTNQVPLFPQDAFMEGPMMAMDKEVDKPETYGLPAGWSGFVGGMMTLVRVLPPDQYEKITRLNTKLPAQPFQEKPSNEMHRHDN